MTRSRCPSRASPRPNSTAARARRESFADRRARRAEVDDPTVVLDAALRFLEARQRSIAEVRRRLSTAGYRDDLIAAAIERLGDLGMLDDHAFATQWVESRDRARPRGERALRAELAQRGVDRAVVESVLDARRTAADEDSLDPESHGAAPGSADEAAAARLLERRGRSIARVSDLRARRERAYGLLARNGFDSSVASQVAARWALDAQDEAEPDTTDEAIGSVADP